MTTFLKLSTLILILTACMDLQGPDYVGADQKNLLSRIEISERAVMIQVGDSLQLNAKAISASKDTLLIDGANLVFSSDDPVIALVSSTGMLRANTVNTLPVRIAVSYKHDRVTKVDTIPVYVTQERYDVTSVQLIALDSNSVGRGGVEIFGVPRIRLDLYDGSTLIARGVRAYLDKPSQIDLQFREAQEDSIGDYYIVENTKGLIGKFWIKAALNLYGTNVADSVLFNGKYASGFGAQVYEIEPGVIAGDFSPGTPALSVQPCALVSFNNFLPYPIDIVFSDSMAAPDGCPPIVLEGEVADFISHNIVGGNVYDVQPYGFILRRSNTLGEIQIYFRNAVTKDSVNYASRIDAREVPVD